MKEFSPTFCILPWTHLATYTSGDVLLCCVAQNHLKLNLNETTLAKAWNSDVLKETRMKMLRGEKVSACTHCYREESVGYTSHRLAENLTWERRFSAEWLEKRVEATKPDGQFDEGLVSVDLRLGNSCNLTCVMCRPQDSSKWLGVAKKMENSLRDESLYNEWKQKADINQSRFEWYKKEEFWNDLLQILPYIRELIIGGGEPMLLEEHKALLEACVSTGHASHIQIRYHTNGTILDEKIFEKWRHFQLVETFISMDGVGERNHYMRHPANWPTLEKNLHKLDSYPYGNLRAFLLCSVHLMSVFYLDEYAEWVRKQNFKLVAKGPDGYFHPGVVHYPSYMSVQVLPKEIKEMVTKKIRDFEAKSPQPSSKIEGIINFMNEEDHSDQLLKTKEYIRAMDRGRKTSFSESLPELHKLLNF